MKIDLQHVGDDRQPVVTIDHFTGEVTKPLEYAARLRPFPSSRNGYPGLRRPLSSEDVEAGRYVDFCLRRIAPVLQRVFGATRFQCLEASFSMVTTPAADLTPAQRVPHFDSVDPNYVAVLHYLTECAGTAFYRQRSTGIEMLTAERLEPYRAGLQAADDVPAGYMAGSDDSYERIGHIDGRLDRLAVYRGAMLHSGIIPEDPAIDGEEFPGRLTTNIFVHIQ